MRGFAEAVTTNGWMRRTLTALVAVLTLVFSGVCDQVDHLDLGDPGRSDIGPVRHEGYALGYSKKHSQALWTQYRLTKENMYACMGKSRYSGEFVKDPDVPLAQAMARDYSKSGYEQGHLVPDFDLRYSLTAQKETFYYSNVCPQSEGFNRGIWKKLENKVRSLAVREGSIVIVTGPIFPFFGGRKLGDEVTVPKKFFKVIYSEGEKPKMIGFIIPHASSQASLRTFVCTVAKVEAETGLKFFNKLPPDVQKDLKTHSSPDDWDIK